MPWKNGGGSTAQIAIFPKGSDFRLGDFKWRLSSAKIEQQGDFSLFPKHDRILVVLGGAGLVLTNKSENRDLPEKIVLKLHEPYLFSGDLPMSCELLGGPVRDLNLFFLKQWVTARFEIITLNSSERCEIPMKGNVMLAVQLFGQIHVESESLAEGEFLQIDQTLDSSRFLSVQSGPDRAGFIVFTLSY